MAIENGSIDQNADPPLSNEAAEAAGDGFMSDLLQSEGCSVTQAELDSCVATLCALRYDDLLLSQCAPVLEVGQRLFKRHILQAEFGRQDVLAYMKEKHEHHQMLRKLQKLQAQIAEHHDVRCQQAQKAGINRQRHERLRAIQDRPEPLLTAVGPLTSAADPIALPAPDAGADTDGNAHPGATASSAVTHSAAEESPCEAVQRGADSAARATAPVPLGTSTASAGRALAGECGEPATTESQAEVEARCNSAEAAEPSIDEIRAAAALPQGSFRRFCNICKQRYRQVHEFYHQLCPECAAFNWQKRVQSADMTGMVCVVTGGRVRIGYQIVLKLLRAGGYVLTTTRYPADAALRYAQEADFADFASRLEVVGPLELSDVGLVERFCDALCARFERIHVLINNAAQTLTRASGWFARMDAMEAAAASALPAAARRVLIDSRPLLIPSDNGAPAPMLTWNETDAVDCAAAALPAPAEAVEPTASMGSIPVDETASSASAATDGAHSSCACGVVDGTRDAPSQPDEAASDARGRSAATGAGAAFRVVRGHMVGGFDARNEQAAFPVHRLDESAQPLDLSAQNSWSRKLGEVSTSEMLHTVAANTVAPFVLCGRLRSILSPAAVVAATGGSGDGVDARLWGHIVNVSALEGKFGVAKKQSCHPHTNMAKAALNMLTCSGAIGLYQEKILINSVDTGWVTDMAPGGVGVLAATHETQVGPPLDEVDGAARVLDPIFSHLLDNKWTMRGRLWKDYKMSAW